MPLRTPVKLPITDLPTDAIAQSYERRSITRVVGLYSGKPSFTAIWLEVGQVITSLTYESDSVAMVSGTHCFVALYKDLSTLLGQSADDTAITWAAYTRKTKTLTAPYTVTGTGWHYGMICVNAATPNNVAAHTLGSNAANGAPRAPILGGSVTATGITGTAPSSFTLHAGYLNDAPYLTVQ